MSPERQLPYENLFKGFRKTRFTTREQLMGAAEFDYSIFSEDRGDVSQPTYDYETYERVDREGLAVFTGYLDSAANFASLGGIFIKADPEASEPMLRRMGDDTAYMWVLATDPKCGGLGLGKKTLQDTMQIAREHGKTKMITTVHPDNYNSLKSFFDNGFVAVARACNYYNMLGMDGERLILLNGDLNNPDWSEKMAVPTSIMVASTDEMLEKWKDINTLINFLTFEIGMASRTCLRTSDKVLLQPYKYLGDVLEVAKLIYPYESFAEAYTIEQKMSGDMKEWPLFDIIAYHNLFHMGRMFKVGDQMVTPLFSVFKSQIHRFFMQWISDYRAHFLNSSSKIDDFESSFEAASFIDDIPLIELIYIYLEAENSVLRGLINNAPGGSVVVEKPIYEDFYDTYGQPKDKEDRDIFKNASKELLKQNLLMHLMFEATKPKSLKKRLGNFAAHFSNIQFRK